MSYRFINFILLIRKVMKNIFHLCELRLTHSGPLTRVHSLTLETANSTRVQGLNHMQNSANVVIMGYQESYYKLYSPSLGIAELLVHEQRDGSVSAAKINWFSAHTKFEKLAKGGDVEVGDTHPTKDNLLEIGKDEEKSSPQSSFFLPLFITYVMTSYGRRTHGQI